jgi:SNF2 family DNA or RNA helicase
MKVRTFSNHQWTLTKGTRKTDLRIAHHIRNRSSQIFKAALKIRSIYRWCLTGTPIHNSIDDYGALLSFIGIEPFYEKSSFDYWIVSSLKENRPGSLQLLRNLVRATCLRRTKASQAVCLNLEKCIEKTEEVHLHQEDQLLYDFFKKKTADIAAGVHRMDKNKLRRKSTRDENILSLMNFLRAICNHGSELLPLSALAAWENSDNSQVDWKMIQASGTTCNQCGQECVAKRSSSMPRSPNGAYDIDVCEDCAVVRDEESGNTRASSEDASALATTGTSKASKSAADFARPSAKVVRLLENLQQEQRGHVLEKPRKRYVVPRIRSFR